MLRICGGDTHRPRICVQGWWMQEHLAQVYRNGLIRFTCGGKYGKAK